MNQAPAWMNISLVRHKQRIVVLTPTSGKWISCSLMETERSNCAARYQCNRIKIFSQIITIDREMWGLWVLWCFMMFYKAMLYHTVPKHDFTVLYNTLDDWNIKTCFGHMVSQFFMINYLVNCFIGWHEVTVGLSYLSAVLNDLFSIWWLYLLGTLFSQTSMNALKRGQNGSRDFGSYFFHVKFCRTLIEFPMLQILNFRCTP